MVLESMASQAVFLVGRVLFAGVLAFMSVNHFTNTDEMAGYAESKGVPLPKIAVVGGGVLLLAGAVSIVLGVYPTVGAVLIALFFVGVTPVMHDFWSVDGEQRQQEMIQFLKNTALLGAALVFLSLGGAAWPYSLGVGF